MVDGHHADIDHFVVYDYCNNCGEMKEEINLIGDLCEGCYSHFNDELEVQH